MPQPLQAHCLPSTSSITPIQPRNITSVGAPLSEEGSAQGSVTTFQNFQMWGFVKILKLPLEATRATQDRQNHLRGSPFSLTHHIILSLNSSYHKKVILFFPKMCLDPSYCDQLSPQLLASRAGETGPSPPTCSSSVPAPPCPPRDPSTHLPSTALQQLCMQPQSGAELRPSLEDICSFLPCPQFLHGKGGRDR